MVKHCMILIFTFSTILFCYSQESDTIFELGQGVVDGNPIFDGDLNSFIKNNIIYPKNAVLDSVEGNVYISFWIEINGFTTDHKVLKGVRDDLDQEAVRIAKLLVFDKAATKRGQLVKIPYFIRVKFQLKDIKSNPKFP